ncbi:hypothetical protein SteCoe_22214 [Stentor coeruleus]|uniref:Mitochondrial import inner membrane translocase subunit TIM22 n=1 Tax=Stentor coeruleus TaxID=5963 RepID=A0A1R2BMS1_9CILI|nr:hypothetical protein SteCoe_22214 [Stentor coeruleus]
MAQREPCPDRFFDDLGGAFAMGCAGGSIYYFFKGFISAPSRERFKGALNAVKHRGPVLGGGFAMWGGLFSVFDCSLLWYRQKEGPLNAIAAGFGTGGILAIRAGLHICWRNAIAGGIILAVIEGVGVAYNNFMVKQQMLMMHEVSKINEERMKRMSIGLPDYSQEELQGKLMEKAQEQQNSGFFGSLFNRG